MTPDPLDPGLRPDLRATGATAASLLPLVERECARLGLALVRVDWSGDRGSAQGGTLQVMAEEPATGQLTLERCAELSRALSERLDEADPLPSAYHLEVSSPGIDRPLTRAADFARWTGHEVELERLGGDGPRRLRGPLATAGEGMVAVETARGRVEVQMEQLLRARLRLTPALLAATAPLDASGADEWEETDEEAPANGDERRRPSDDAGQQEDATP